MKTLIKMTALAAAAGVAFTAVPASAAQLPTTGQHAVAPADDTWNQRDRRWRDRDDRRYDRGYNRGNRGYDRGYDQGRNYGDPVYRDTRVWRGNDGRTYCRKKDGTTGLIIGGAAGALLGREVDGGRDRTLGTILGAAAGALIGKSLDDGVRCR